MWLRRIGLLGFVSAGVGCGLLLGRGEPDRSLHAIPGTEGPISLYISNSTDQPLCEVHLVPIERGDLGPNWLAGKQIAARSYGEAFIHAGSYRISARSCGGAYATTGELTVTRQSTFSITFREWISRMKDPHRDEFNGIVPSPEYIAHPPHYSGGNNGNAGNGDNANPDCTPDGQDEKATGGADCCSAFTHGVFRGGASVATRVCGPDQ